MPFAAFGLRRFRMIFMLYYLDVIFIWFLILNLDWKFSVLKRRQLVALVADTCSALHLRCSIENVTLVDWVELMKRRLAAVTVAFYSGVARLLSIWSRRRLSLVVVDGDCRRSTLDARRSDCCTRIASVHTLAHTRAHTPNLTHKFTCESLLGLPLIYSCRALLAYEWYSSCVYQLVCAAPVYMCVCVCAMPCFALKCPWHCLLEWVCWLPVLGAVVLFKRYRFCCCLCLLFIACEQQHTETHQYTQRYSSVYTK